MKSKNSLIIGRGIFLIFIILAFGLIILNEKGNIFLEKKASKEIDAYYEENYEDIKDSLEKEALGFKNKTYQSKIISKKNKNLYFTIQYKNKKVVDTYKQDYEEGKSLLDYLDKKLEKEIEKKTKIKCKVYPVTTLDHYSEKVQERILKEEDLLQLKYYVIETDIEVKDWSGKSVLKTITNVIEELNRQNITPKYYDFVLAEEEDITNSIIIHNIPDDFLEKDAEQILDDAINNPESDLIKENKIVVEYQNEEG